MRRKVLSMKKILVAYFSATGTTRKAAKALAEAADADLYEIRPKVPYTAKDLDWMDPRSRSSLGKKGPGRPLPVTFWYHNAAPASYDVIFLGFPIWWYEAPKIITSFLKAYDFSDKKIILFATSGGSGFGKTLEKLKPAAGPHADLMEGRILNGRVGEGTLKKLLAASV